MNPEPYQTLNLKPRLAAPRAAQKDGKARKEDVFAAPTTQYIKATKGQLLSWQLTLSNRGALPITAARISVVVPDLRDREKAKALCAPTLVPWQHLEP